MEFGSPGLGVHIHEYLLHQKSSYSGCKLKLLWSDWCSRKICLPWIGDLTLSWEASEICIWFRNNVFNVSFTFSFISWLPWNLRKSLYMTVCVSHLISLAFVFWRERWLFTQSVEPSDFQTQCCVSMHVCFFSPQVTLVDNLQPMWRWEMNKNILVKKRVQTQLHWSEWL